MGISPQLLGPLSNAIGDRFGFLELDAILYKCSFDRIINEIANDKEPTRVIARKCIDEAERKGIAKTFLAHIIASRVNDDELRGLVQQALPEALATLPEMKAQVDDVLIALEKTRHNIHDPATKAAIRDSQSALESVIRGISLLDGYKNLHDSLHRLQLRQLPLLLAAARSIAKDETQIDSLSEYQDQVRTSAESAALMLERLPDDSNLRAIERKWIGKLQEAARNFQKAIDERNASSASLAVYAFWRLLEVHPQRLNEAIFAAAKDLRLDELSNTLENVGKVVNDAGGEIAKAKTSLKELSIVLRGRVAEHDMWQNIDDGLWALDKIFDQSAGTTVEDFISVWPATRSAVRALAALSPDAQWSRNIATYSGNVDEQLVRIEAQSASDTAGLGTDSSQKRLSRLFNAFRREARVRFFVVDELLKHECGLLIKIGTPMQSILGDLDNG
jgi:hypothetical protein